MPTGHATRPLANWLSGTRDDLRAAGRRFARTPFTAVTMVLVLALGIGVNAAAFTAFHSLRTRPARGIPANGSLVRIRGIASSRALGRVVGRPLSLAELRADGELHAVFDDVAGWTTDNATLDPLSAQGTGAAGAGFTIVGTSFVTSDYFRVLGVRPVLGRTPAATALEAVIDQRLWRDLLGGGSDVIGRSIKLDDAVVTVVGVAPPGFVGPNATTSGYMVWLPLDARRVVNGASGPPATDDGTLELSAAAHLRQGVSMERATAAVTSVAGRNAPRAAGGGRASEASADVVPMLATNETPAIVDDTLAREVYGGIGALILLVTGASVSALFAGAGVARRREIAIRLSLGGRRMRIVRQLLTESVLVALAGGALGLLVFLVLLRGAAAELPGIDLGIDWMTVALTAGFAAGTGILCGLSPALHATRFPVSSALKETTAASTSRLGLQRRLVIAQIALTQPLLLGLAALITVMGRDARGVAAPAVADRIVSVSFDQTAMSGSRTEMNAKLASLSAKIAALPFTRGVVRHSSGYSPWDVGDATTSFRAHAYYAAPGYFALLDAPIVRGREFRQGDRNVAVIESDLAHRLWGTADPIGRTLHRSRRNGESASDVTVIGVVDAASVGPSVEGGPGGAATRIFVPLDPGTSNLAEGSGTMFPLRTSPYELLVRTSGAAAPAIPELRRLAASERIRAPLLHVETLSELDAERRTEQMRSSGIAGGAGILALLLASIGLYAVIALSVGQRLREIGIRLALGARPRQVVGLFFREGLRLGGFGIALGLPLSVLTLHTLGVQVPVPNAVLGGAIATMVLAVTAFATWLPARRAAAADPLVSLRAE